jgi:DNA polymerase III subunit delta'
MDLGTNPDYRLVTKDLARFSEDPDVRRRVLQDFSIEVVREFIIAQAGLTSAGGRGKVFVIRQAELMNRFAQNALLKTLEEPPRGVTLILLCPSPEDMLPTVRSRCALVRFGPLPADFVAGRLLDAGVEAAQARFWAAHTFGSLGESLRLAAGGFYAVKREIVDRLAGLVKDVDAEMGEWLAKLTESLAEAAVSAEKQLSPALAKRQAAEVLLGLFAGVYKDVLAVAMGRTITVHADQADRIAVMAEALGADKAAEILGQMGRYEQLLWRNVNAKVLWDNVVITCATGAALTA